MNKSKQEEYAYLPKSVYGSWIPVTVVNIKRNIFLMRWRILGMNHSTHVYSMKLKFVTKKRKNKKKKKRKRWKIRSSCNVLPCIKTLSKHCLMFASILYFSIRLKSLNDRDFSTILSSHKQFRSIDVKQAMKQSSFISWQIHDAKRRRSCSKLKSNSLLILARFYQLFIG